MEPLLDSANEAVAKLEGRLIQHPGVTLKWTGFKVAQDHSRLVAQWLAIPTTDEMRERFAKLPGPSWAGESSVAGPEVLGVYSSVPGDIGTYRRGEVFDISLQPGQRCLQVEDFHSDPARDKGTEVGMKVCLEARERLEAYLKANGILLEA
jgi:hypothetical protein